MILDATFIFILIKAWGELGGYLYLILGIIAWLTWEVIRTIKYGLEK
jgi:hypothetical protein